MAIHMSCGRRGSWHAMRASTDRRQGIGVWPIWSRERCARSSAKRKSSRTRCATILNRDAEFEQKMAEVLCVYREVEVLKKAAAEETKKKTSKTSRKTVAIVSYDEKP